MSSEATRTAGTYAGASAAILAVLRAPAGARLRSLPTRVPARKPAYSEGGEMRFSFGPNSAQRTIAAMAMKPSLGPIFLPSE